jgi:hypothetical protein
LQGVSNQNEGYDSDQEEKLVFFWTEEKDSTNKSRKEKENWKREFLNHFVVKN